MRSRSRLGSVKRAKTLTGTFRPKLSEVDASPQSNRKAVTDDGRSKCCLTIKNSRQLSLVVYTVIEYLGHVSSYHPSNSSLELKSVQPTLTVVKIPTALHRVGSTGM